MSYDYRNRNRNREVVPWISLPSGDESPTTAAAATTASQESQQNYARTTGTSCKILSLLAARERVGSRDQLCGGRIGWLNSDVVVTSDGLAMAGAW